jgi:hypothetical protein
MYVLIMTIEDTQSTIFCSSYSDACSKLEMAYNTFFNEAVSFRIEKLPE